MMDKEDKLWYDVLIERGHTPIMDRDGELNIFVWEEDYHNGPGCSECNWSCCMFCDRDPYKAVPLKCEKS